MTDETTCQIHASCVDVAGRGLLITGASGSGKSTLALSLIALGARLVADDQVCLNVEGGSLVARRPATLPPLIEARGIGLLQADTVAHSRVAAVVDMDALETDRLPHHLSTMFLGCEIRRFRRVDGPQFAPALLLALKNGAHDADARI